jgi:hypothetical protein
VTTTGRQAILDAFDQLFDAATSHLQATCTAEERTAARTQFAERLGPVLDALESAKALALDEAEMGEMRRAVEQLSPADVAALVASIPLAQRTHERLRALAYERAREQMLLQLTASAEPSPYGGH